MPQLACIGRRRKICHENLHKLLDCFLKFVGKNVVKQLQISVKIARRFCNDAKLSLMVHLTLLFFLSHINNPWTQIQIRRRGSQVSTFCMTCHGPHCFLMLLNGKLCYKLLGLNWSSCRYGFWTNQTSKSKRFKCRMCAIRFLPFLRSTSFLVAEPISIVFRTTKIGFVSWRRKTTKFARPEITQFWQHKFPRSGPARSGVVSFVA